MATDAFKLLGTSRKEIAVVHVNEGHRYSFGVSMFNNRRILGDCFIARNGRAPHAPEHFGIEARLFAYAAGRKRKVIDK